jgi:NAD(P)H dehydrogenase (quinone)
MRKPENYQPGRERHAVILCHPDPDSFNHAVARAYCDAVRECGQEAVLRDLYAMDFDPVLKAQERPTVPGFQPSADVVEERALLEGVDVFVLIYPIWFGTPPAMLKGYVERVLGAGVDPKSIQSHSRQTLLSGKRLVSFSTSAATGAWLNEQGEFLSLRYVFDRYLAHAFSMRSDEHIHFAPIVPDMRQRFIDEHLFTVRENARRLCSTLLMEHRPGQRPESALAGA